MFEYLTLKSGNFGLGGAEIVSQILPLNFCFMFQWIDEESISASEYVNLGHRCSVREFS
jgi:hypothetical protein